MEVEIAKKEKKKQSTSVGTLSHQNTKTSKTSGRHAVKNLITQLRESFLKRATFASADIDASEQLEHQAALFQRIQAKGRTLHADFSNT